MKKMLIFSMLIIQAIGISVIGAQDSKEARVKALENAKVSLDDLGDTFDSEVDSGRIEMLKDESDTEIDVDLLKRDHEKLLDPTYLSEHLFNEILSMVERSEREMDTAAKRRKDTEQSGLIVENLVSTLRKCKESGDLRNHFPTTNSYDVEVIIDEAFEAVFEPNIINDSLFTYLLSESKKEKDARTSAQQSSEDNLAHRIDKCTKEEFIEMVLAKIPSILQKTDLAYFRLFLQILLDDSEQNISNVNIVNACLYFKKLAENKSLPMDLSDGDKLLEEPENVESLNYQLLQRLAAIKTGLDELKPKDVKVVKVTSSGNKDKKTTTLRLHLSKEMAKNTFSSKIFEKFLSDNRHVLEQQIKEEKRDLTLNDIKDGIKSFLDKQIEDVKSKESLTKLQLKCFFGCCCLALKHLEPRYLFLKQPHWINKLNDARIKDANGLVKNDKSPFSFLFQDQQVKEASVIADAVRDEVLKMLGQSSEQIKQHQDLQRWACIDRAAKNKSKEDKATEDKFVEEQRQKQKPQPRKWEKRPVEGQPGKFEWVLIGKKPEKVEPLITTQEFKDFAKDLLGIVEQKHQKQ